jgi:hypothetical protein
VADADLQAQFPFPKTPRIQDPELLATFRTFPCLSCGTKPSEAHHITTRGAGGDDVPENLMPLCTYHHQQWHQKGPDFMITAYPKVRGWLEHWNRTDILDRAKKSRRSAGP